MASADLPAPVRFNPDTARAAAKKRWDAVRTAEKDAEGRTGVDAAPKGDADVARGALLRIVSAKGSADAAVVSAARTILEQAGALAVPKPRTTTALEGMADAELDALLRLLEEAHALPVPHTPSDGAA